MILADWSWVAAVPATVHTLWLRGKWNRNVEAKAAELQRQIYDQYMHGLQLWPRPWTGGRPLTQVEEITKEPYGFTGMPIPPEDQQAQMKEEAQRILDSYKLRRDGNV